MYREALATAPWSDCASEWGRGLGFKLRVAERLETWFDKRSDLSEKLDEVINNLWQKSVISPLLRLVEEGAAEPEGVASKVLLLPNRISA